MNLKIKYRENFRPFAPSVLAEDVSAYFKMDSPCPYRLLVSDVIESRCRQKSPTDEELFAIEMLNVPRSDIPAFAHADYSARIQTVHKETNPRYHALISAFKARTICPVVIKTSFNVRGEPNVATPEDAFRCFMGCEMETLVVGNCVFVKAPTETRPRYGIPEPVLVGLNTAFCLQQLCPQTTKRCRVSRHINYPKANISRSRGLILRRLK